MSLWLISLLGCAAGPRVVPVDFVLADPAAPPGAWDELGARAVDGLRDDLRRGRLLEVVGQGRTLSVDGLGEMPHDVSAAAFALSVHPVPVQHIDLLLRVDGAHGPGLRPLTIELGDRVLTLTWKEVSPLPREDGPASVVAREAVARRFGLGGLLDGTATWSHGELDAVDRALAAVEPEVIALLQGMPLIRQHTSTRAPGRELAWFDPRTEPPSIEVYDLAFAPASGAVGPLDALQPLATMTLVHEFGHVLADAPLRRAWLRTVDGPSTREELRALRRGGPVVAAWRDVRDHRAPTPYGRRDAHESFAEAYALHRLDPEALSAIMPNGAAWFAAGLHLKAAGVTQD